MNSREAIRQSFVTKLALYLSQNTRDMSLPLTIDNGVVLFQVLDFVTANPVNYGIRPIEQGAELYYPGVNIEFLNEADMSPDRLTQKQYLLPVKITVCRFLEGDVNPSALATEVRGIMKSILTCLSDGNVEVWDYTGITPIFSNRVGAWAKTGGYALDDESAAIASGDIRHTLSLNIFYDDFD